MRAEGAESADSDERCAVCGEGAAGADGAVCANMAAVCAEGAVRAEGAGKKKNIYMQKNHHVFEDDRLRELRFESLQKIMKNTVEISLASSY